MSAATDAPARPPGPAGPAPRLRRSRPTLVAAVAVGVVVALLMLVLITREPGDERTSSVDLVGEQAPAVEGEVVLGEPFDLGATDRWVVVNFFATWCVPCIEEHPELKGFQEAHDETGDARVISVVYDDKPGDVADFFERNGGDWTVLGSDEGRTALDWGVAKVPESYLVSPTGIIVQRWVGGVTEAGIDEVIDAYAQAPDEGSADDSGDGS